jgi:hypothetical protein
MKQKGLDLARDSCVPPSRPVGPLAPRHRTASGRVEF